MLFSALGGWWFVGLLNGSMIIQKFESDGEAEGKHRVEASLIIILLFYYRVSVSALLRFTSLPIAAEKDRPEVVVTADVPLCGRSRYVIYSIV